MKKNLGQNLIFFLGFIFFLSYFNICSAQTEAVGCCDGINNPAERCIRAITNLGCIERVYSAVTPTWHSGNGNCVNNVCVMDSGGTPGCCCQNDVKQCSSKTKNACGSGRFWQYYNQCSYDCDSCSDNPIPADVKPGEDEPMKPILFKPEVGIPGFQEEVRVGPYLLANYISAIYNYALYLAGILAVIVIMVAGFQWVSAGGNESKIGEAKERIIGAIIGLVIALGSFLLLQIINPQLVATIPLNLENITPVEIPESTTDEIAVENKASSLSSLPDRKKTTYIIVHTSGGLMTRNQVNDYHRSLGWAGIGYNLYIERDGTVVNGRGEDKVGGHTINYNSRSIGIAYDGCQKAVSDQKLSVALSNGTIVQVQLDTLISEIKRLQAKYHISRNNVIGHNSVSQNPKACPCLDMNEIRAKINP